MAFRTQKISQMAPKGADLEATDLIEVSTIESGSYVTRSITGQELIDAIPATVVEWGDIGGTLSTQTDLQSALNAKVPTSRTLTINGTTQDLSANRTFTVATGITIGTTAITSGVVGRVLFEGAGNVVQESANLFWDNVNGRLGIGTSLPTQRLHLLSAANSGNFARVQNTNGGATAAAGYEMQSNTAYGSLFANSSAYVPYGVLAASQIGFYTNNTFAIAIDSATADFRIGIGTAPTEKFRITNGGNVLINTTTDAGFRLDVNGTARVQGLTTLSGTMTASGAIARNQLINGTLLAAANNDTLVGLDINSTFTNGAFTGVKNLSIRVGNSYSQYTSALGHGVELNTSVGISGVLDLGGDSSGLYLWRSGARSNGALIGCTYVSPNFNHIHFGTASIKQMILSTVTGNLLLNTTTDAGFRLDVNGTARVSAKLSVGTPTQVTAVMEITSTTQGFLPPRMTTTQKNAIASPATGLMVYDTTLNLISVYNGTTWITL